MLQLDGAGTRSAFVTSASSVVKLISCFFSFNASLFYLNLVEVGLRKVRKSKLAKVVLDGGWITEQYKYWYGADAITNNGDAFN